VVFNEQPSKVEQVGSTAAGVGPPSRHSCMVFSTVDVNLFSSPCP
jgi:hypothetical protein